MEFLVGMPLKHRIAVKPLELETVQSVGIQIADALDTAPPLESCTATSSQRTSSSPDAVTPRFWIFGLSGNQAIVTPILVRFPQNKLPAGMSAPESPSPETLHLLCTGIPTSAAPSARPHSRGDAPQRSPSRLAARTHTRSPPCRLPPPIPAARIPASGGIPAPESSPQSATAAARKPPHAARPQAGKSASTASRTRAAPPSRVPAERKSYLGCTAPRAAPSLAHPSTTPSPAANPPYAR